MTCQPPVVGMIGSCMLIILSKHLAMSLLMLIDGMYWFWCSHKVQSLYMLRKWHCNLVIHFLDYHVSSQHSLPLIGTLLRNATWVVGCSLLWKDGVCKACWCKGSLDLFPRTYSILSTTIHSCTCVWVLVGVGNIYIACRECSLGGLWVDPSGAIYTCQGVGQMVMSLSILATVGYHAWEDQSQVGTQIFKGS